MNFDRFMLRKYIGHPSDSYVNMFYKVSHKGNPQTSQTSQTLQKQVFAQSFKRDFSAVSNNMLITSNNELISKAICSHFDMVVLMNTYCDLQSKLQYWDVYYCVPTAIPISTFRHVLQCSEHGGEEDEDMSMKP